MKNGDIKSDKNEKFDDVTVAGLNRKKGRKMKSSEKHRNATSANDDKHKKQYKCKRSRNVHGKGNALRMALLA